jgi:hypothetical protein
MHQRNFLVCRRSRFETDETGCTKAVDKITESGDPLRAFRMSMPGVVFFVALIDHNRCS